MSLIEMFYKGGELMWLLLAGLIIAGVVILERLIYFKVTSFPYPVFEKNLIDQINNQTTISQINISLPKKNHNISNFSWKILSYFFNVYDHYKLFLYENSPFVKIAKDFLQYEHLSEKIRSEALSRNASKLINQMERYVRILATIANLAPLVGLLGTVTGLIQAFTKIASHGGTVDVSMLAGGIYEAMLTTAFGLIVAVPAFIFFDFFERMISRRVDYLNYTIQHLNENWLKQNANTH